MIQFFKIFRAHVGSVLLISCFPLLLAYSLPANDSLAEPSEKGAIAGRAVEIPARDYRLAFKVAPPALGECALKMEDGNIKTCSEKFSGEQVFIPRASTSVDVSRVQTVDDVITRGMGGIGLSIGLLGLVSVGVKATAAVRTQTNNKRVTFMSSYDLKTGILTLRNPRPITEIGPSGALYLSEIELGGNEILTVSMEFESVQKKVEVEATVTVKILFWKISAKMRHVKEKFKSASNTKILFVSSWRGIIEKTFTSLDDAIKEVEKIEEMYVNGPAELKKLKPTDERLHNTYCFSAWKRSPYGENMNQVIMNSDLTTLSEQLTETEGVIKQIDQYFEKGPWDPTRGKSAENLKASLTSLKDKLSRGIKSYYKLTASERNDLFGLYGRDKAPGYYHRKLKSIIGY